MSTARLTPRALSSPIALLLTLVLFITSHVNAAASSNEGLHFLSPIPGLNLFLRHVAPTDSRGGPPVLILQGATFPSGNAAGWKIDGRSWMDELASAGYDVYALDFLGYGESDRYPEMASPEANGAPLGDVPSMVMQVDAAVMEILKLHGGQSIDLIAHSGGTFVAGRYAETHPGRVARLVLFGAPAPYEKSTPRSAVTTRYADVSREEELESFEPKVRDTRQLDPVMFDAWAKAYLATDPQSSSRTPPAVRVPAGFFASFAEMNRSGRLPYDPGKITTPTLVIQGEWDAVAPPASGLWVYERLAAPLKRYVILSRAGHRVHLERNRWQLYRETESFLNGGDGS